MDYSEEALQKVREDRLILSALDEWMYEEMEPFIGRRILEIGCGLGNFAHHLTDRELYVGTETAESSVEHMRSRFAAYSNMNSLVVDVTTDEFLTLSRHNFDTVFSLNVFEHIADDVLAVRHAVELLQPQGKLLLVVPAHHRLHGSIDRAIGHYRRYDKKMMGNLFHEAGLRPIKLKYMNPLGALGWFFSGSIRHQTTPPSGQLRLFNTLVPILKHIERVIPAPFGISLLAVGEKP